MKYCITPHWWCIDLCKLHVSYPTKFPCGHLVMSPIHPVAEQTYSVSSPHVLVECRSWTQRHHVCLEGAWCHFGLFSQNAPRGAGSVIRENKRGGQVQGDLAASLPLSSKWKSSRQEKTNTVLFPSAQHAIWVCCHFPESRLKGGGGGGACSVSAIRAPRLWNELDEDGCLRQYLLLNLSWTSMFFRRYISEFTWGAMAILVFYFYRYLRTSICMLNVCFPCCAALCTLCWKVPPRDKAELSSLVAAAGLPLMRQSVSHFTFCLSADGSLVWPAASPWKWHLESPPPPPHLSGPLPPSFPITSRCVAGAAVKHQPPGTEPTWHSSPRTTFIWP